MSSEPRLRRGDDPALLPARDRFRGVVEPCAGFDLDEDQQAATPCHEVDLARGAPPPARGNAIALGHEQGSGPSLGGDAETESGAPLGPDDVLVYVAGLPVIASSHLRSRA